MPAPTKPMTLESLSWHSGYIEGKAQTPAKASTDGVTTSRQQFSYNQKHGSQHLRCPAAAVPAGQAGRSRRGDYSHPAQPAGGQAGPGAVSRQEARIGTIPPSGG